MKEPSIILHLILVPQEQKQTGDRLVLDAKVFDIRHWRMTGARVRLFDSYPVKVLGNENGWRVIDRYATTEAFPKVGDPVEMLLRRTKMGFDLMSLVKKH